MRSIKMCILLPILKNFNLFLAGGNLRLINMQLLIWDIAKLYVILTSELVKALGKSKFTSPHYFIPACNITKSMSYEFFSQNNPAKVCFNHKKEIFIIVRRHPELVSGSFKLDSGSSLE